MLFEFEQLLFYHFDLLLLALKLDALLFLLGRRHVGFEKVGVVGVSSEDSLVVHDVASTTSILIFLPKGSKAVVSIRILELLLATHNLWLGSVKCLSHFKL